MRQTALPDNQIRQPGCGQIKHLRPEFPNLADRERFAPNREFLQPEQGLRQAVCGLLGNHQGTGPPCRRRTLRRPDRIGHRGEAVSLEQVGEPGFDLVDQTGAGKDQRRVELHQGGARADLGIGILVVESDDLVNYRHVDGRLESILREEATSAK